MARFGAGSRRKFRASTRVFMGRGGPRIGFVTPGIRRVKPRRSRKNDATKLMKDMVKP